MPGEPLKHWPHAELSLTFENSLLELLMLYNPVSRQRPAPAIETTHITKGQIRRSSKKGGDFLLRKTQPLSSVFPNGFLSGYGQRQVHAVKGHPIDQPFPIRPFVPRQRIAKTAIIEEVTMLIPTDASKLGTDWRERVWQIHLLAFERIMAIAEVLQVPVQSGGNRNAVVSAQGDPLPCTLDFKNIPATIWRDKFHLERPGPRHALDQVADCFGIFRALLRSRGTPEEQSRKKQAD